MACPCEIETRSCSDEQRSLEKHFVQKFYHFTLSQTCKHIPQIANRFDHGRQVLTRLIRKAALQYTNACGEDALWLPKIAAVATATRICACHAGHPEVRPSLASGHEGIGLRIAFAIEQNNLICCNVAKLRYLRIGPSLSWRDDPGLSCSVPL